MSNVLGILLILGFVGGGIYVFVTKGSATLKREKRFVSIGLFTLVLINVLNGCVLADKVAEGDKKLTGARGAIEKAYVDSVPTFEEIVASPGLDANAKLSKHVSAFRAETDLLNEEKAFLESIVDFEVAQAFRLPPNFEKAIKDETGRNVEPSDFSDYVERLYRSYFVRTYAPSPEYTFLKYNVNAMSVADIEREMAFNAYADGREFRTLDGDRNNGLNIDESELSEVVFARYDRDGDGIISRLDFAAGKAESRLTLYSIVIGVIEAAREARVRELPRLAFKPPSSAMVERCHLKEKQFFEPIVLEIQAQLDEVALYTFLNELAKGQKLGADRQGLAIERLVIESPNALGEKPGQFLVNATFDVVAYRINPEQSLAVEEEEDETGGNRRRSSRPRHW